MNDIIIGLLIGILLLQFVMFVMSQVALRNLTQKQQSTIYGVSHIWGSIKELREELNSKVILPLIPPNSMGAEVQPDKIIEGVVNNDE
tara:strand:+ start:3187 stop:3450 length:264 start_codon:yes stop_codon:yes gene_type:complete